MGADKFAMECMLMFRMRELTELPHTRQNSAKIIVPRKDDKSSIRLPFSRWR